MTLTDANQGISLTVDQYRAFLNAIPEINASLREAGIDIATSDTRMKPQKKAKVKKDRSNIEATSDEEE
jgi:ribosomal protein S9